MRWDFFIQHWTARLLNDNALVSVMGRADFITPAQSSRPVEVPSIEYTLVTDTESELWNAVTIQVDTWAKGWVKSAQIERRLRIITSLDVGQDLGGERVWIKHQDSRTIDYNTDTKTVHRTHDFLFEAARGKYVGQ